jgi:VWFA-related protein
MLKQETRLYIVAFHFLTVLFATSSLTYSQEDVIRVETDLVTVPVTVLDREGRYVTNLEKENFKIYQDGSEQAISFFEPISEPLTVFLLLDNSGSMDKQLPELAVAASAFVNQLRDDDQVIVALFDDRVDVVNKGTSVKDLRNNVINVLRTRGSPAITMVYDAVESALKQVKKVRGRKAVILFSDGVGSGYFASAKSTLRDAEEGDALIYTIQFNTYSEVVPRNVSKKKYFKDLKAADVYMQNLAQATGGRRVRVEGVSNLRNAFAQVAEELGQQYRIGYYPKETGKKGDRREIKVKVDVPGAAVRARSSYIVGAPKH